MDYFIQSFLPHGLKWLKYTRNDKGEINDNFVSDDIMVELPAGSSEKNVVKVNEEQHAFLMSDVQFKKLLTLAKGGVRFIDKFPARMLDDKTRLAEKDAQIRQLQADLARARAGQV